MAAIVGRGKRSISANSDELIAARPSSRPRARMSLMSAPETNADSPAPVMMRTPTSRFAASHVRAARTSLTVSRFSAFFTSGRSIVSVATDSAISSLVFIDAFPDFPAEPACLDVLCQQRAGAVLLTHAPVQVLEDAETGVEADEIHQFERPHRMVEPELERLVDVARRCHPLHLHVERLVADAGVDARGDKAG